MYAFIRKIHRELKVIGYQIHAIAGFFTEPWVQRRHDSQRHSLLKQRPGQAKVTDKVAIFLLYQPAGLAESTLRTCAYLVKKGYAPMVISNAPLSAADQDKLSAVSWKIIERPNIGYDFGGYRDGIWLLDVWGIVPQNLIIMNDSIWFPLYDDETLISHMENSQADFVGALELGLSRPSQNALKTKQPFFGSYFLMLKRPALSHAAFKTFWLRYRLTGNKLKTVKHGERGFSRAMAEAGISLEGVYSRQKFDDYVETLDSQALKALLPDLIVSDEKSEGAISSCLTAFEDSPAWRDAARALCIKATEKRNILATAPIASLMHFDVPFLKKGRDFNNLKVLSLIHEKTKRGELHRLHPLIFQEIKNSLAPDANTTV